MNTKKRTMSLSRQEERIIETALHRYTTVLMNASKNDKIGFSERAMAGVERIETDQLLERFFRRHK